MTVDGATLENALYRTRVRGCLLGGAIGDALGAPVEFWSRDKINRHTNGCGVREYLPVSFGHASGVGLVTDDTQMTLFIAEGIIRGRVREDRGLGFTVAVTHHAMLRWLDTQTHRAPTGERDGWLQAEQWLYSRRAPGNTCMSALQTVAEPFGGPARNNSKGCGAVMRSAPFGLAQVRTDTAYEVACESAGYTHGHATAQTAAGALAWLVRTLLDGKDLQDAVQGLVGFLERDSRAVETRAAVLSALRAAAARPGDSDALEQLGAGWTGHEALAIAIYAALSHSPPAAMLDALTLAVSHGGDSDSTGSLCGNILGAHHGESALPAALAFEVEGRATILQVADDFILEDTCGAQLHGDYGPVTRWTDRYPGW